MVDKLEEEIQLIIGSSYPVSLKSLYDRARGTPTSSIHRWADHNPSHVEPLALALVEGLEIWPYAADLLRLFAGVSEVCQIVLESSPALLSTLLDKATASEDGFQQSSSLCVTLLRCPLPQGIALPATVQTFLGQLFEAAVRKPCVETVEPVHAILQGACAPMLELLPAASVNRFRDHLKGMMKTANNSIPQPTTIYCLAILTKLNVHFRRQRHRNLSPSTSAGRSSSVSQHEQEELSGLFHGDRAHKVIFLVICQVWHACGADKSLSDPGALTLVLLAREIIANIDSETLGAWVCRVSNKGFINKLNEKVCGKVRTESIQIQAITFCCALLEPNTISEHVVVAFEQRLLRSGNDTYEEQDSQEPLAVILPVLAPRVSSRTWSSLVQKLMAYMGNIKLQLPSQVLSLVRLMKSLRSIMPTCSLLRVSIFEALSADAHKDHLQQISIISRPAEQRNNEVASTFMSLVLSAGLCAQAHEPSIPTPMIMQMLEKQESLAEVPAAVKPTLHREASILHLAPADQMNKPLYRGRFWKDHLNAELDMQAKQSRDTIIQRFGEACRNLEDRCHDIEKPLREEEAKSEELQRSLTTAETCNAKLREKLSTVDARATTLQGQNVQLSAELHTASEELEAKSEHAERLEEKLEEVSKTSAEQLQRVAQKYETQAMELQALSATYSDKMEAARLAHSKIEAQLEEAWKLVDDHKDVAKETNTEVVRLRKVEQDLQERVKGLQDNFDATKCDFHKVSDQYVKERNRHHLASEQLETAQAELNRAKHDMQAATTKHTAELEEHRQSSEQARVEHDRLVSGLNQQAFDGREHFEARIKQLTEESIAANAEHDAFKVEKSKTMSELKRQCRQLINERERQSAELTKAQEWRNKVMGVMDLGGDGANMPRPAPASPTRVPRQRQDRKTATLTPEDDMSDISEPEVQRKASFGSQSSSMRSAPSPKRAKPRKGFRVPFPKDPVDDIEVDPATAQKQSSYGALCERTANPRELPARRHSTRHSKSSSTLKQAAQIPSSRKSMVTLSTWDDDEGLEEAFDQSQAGQENIETGANRHSNAGFSGFRTQDFDETTVEI